MWKEGNAIKDYLTPEQIRLLLEPKTSQTKFAEDLGMRFRTYQERLLDNGHDWRLEEIINISKYNDGRLLLTSNGKKYQINIKKMAD